MRKAAEFVKTLTDEKQKFLRDYFKNAPDWLMNSFQLVRFPEDAIMVEEGEAADRIFVLLDGEVSAVEHRVLGVQYKHFAFPSLEIFGTMEIIGGIETYMTTLVTKTPCVCLKTSRKLYEKWMNEDFEVFRMEARKIELYLLKQVRRERLNVLVGGAERIALRICRKYEQILEKGKNVLCMSRKEFVETTGLSERTVTRILGDFEERGLILRKSWDVVVGEEQYRRMKSLLENKVSFAAEFEKNKHATGRRSMDIKQSIWVNEE